MTSNDEEFILFEKQGGNFQNNIYIKLEHKLYTSYANQTQPFFF